MKVVEAAALFADQVGDDDALILAPPLGPGDRVLQEWSYPPAADGSVLRGVDVYTVRNGLIAARTSSPSELRVRPPAEPGYGRVMGN